jgi:hypothetical protein
LFGLAARWKRSRADPLAQLAHAIEALGEEDRRLGDESARVEQLRLSGAQELHTICRGFIEALNLKLSRPALLLDPGEYSAATYNDGVPCLFQINLRGRLLQLEFCATEELYSTEEFRLPYVLYGTVRSFNQDFLDHNTVDEKSIYYCPKGEYGHWYYFDSRTYGNGLLTQDFFIAAMAQLL